jgi:hypothetical protein
LFAAIMKHSIMQKDLIDFLLTELRQRPGMFLSAYSISYLDIYLTGVQITCWQLDKSGAYSERFFGEDGFIKWSWQKYNLDHPSFRLHHYLKLANEDETEALDLFFKDVEQFISEKFRQYTQ